jgi:hypothetical protein
MLYITLKGHQCDIVLNLHAPTEDRDDALKDSFHEKLEKIFDRLSGHHMKIFLGDFNAKVGREDIFKPIIGNESLDINSAWGSIRDNIKTAKENLGYHKLKYNKPWFDDGCSKLIDNVIRLNYSVAKSKPNQ